MSAEMRRLLDDPNHPRELKRQGDRLLGESIETLGEYIALANLELETAHKESDKDTVNHMADSMVSSLDEQWPFHGHWLVIAGKWTRYGFALTDDALYFGESTEDVFTTTLNNGFAHRRPTPDEPPRIGYSFMIGSAQLLNHRIQGSLTALAFAEPNEVQLGYARPAEKATADAKALSTAARYYDSLLELYTKNPNSTFYKSSAEKQQQFFKGIVDDLDELITTPDFQTVCRYAEVPYV